jgi:hypothetical protein
MPVANVVKLSSQVTPFRLEISFQVIMDDGTVHPCLAHVAHKKHLVESYKSNDGYTPQVPQNKPNTITKLSLNEFHQAFDLYYDHLAAAILHGGWDLNPSAPAMEFDTGKGLCFHSDAATLGGNVHCFPTVPVTLVTTNTYGLTSADFANFIRVLRCLWSAGDRFYNDQGVVETNASAVASEMGKARQSLQAIGATQWYLHLTSELERLAIQKRLSDSTKQMHTAQTKAVNTMVKAPKVKGANFV